MLPGGHKWVSICNSSLLGGVSAGNVPGRIVFLRRTDYSDPLMSVEEAREERKSEAVRVDQLPFENFHGYNIADDQAVEVNRLGIRQELLNRSRRWFPQLNDEDHMVDPRINHELESREARRISDNREREGWFRSRWRPGRGFLQNCRNLTRFSGSLIEAETRQRYGPDENVRGKRMYVANQLWNGLTGAEQAAINAQMGAIVGPPLGPLTPAGQLALATHQQLLDLQENLPFLAAPLPGPLFPSARDIQPANNFQILLELSEVQAAQRKKVLTTTVYDATRLQLMLDEIETDYPDLFNMIVTQILENDALYPIENNPQAKALLAYLETFTENGNYAALQARLTEIHDNLPRQQGATEEGQEQTDEQRRIERVQELSSNLAEMHGQLSDKYVEADTMGQHVYDANADAAHAQVPAAPAVGGGAPVDTGYRAAQDRAAAARDESRKLRNEINKMETKFAQNAHEMLRSIHTANPFPGTAPTPLSNLDTFNGTIFGQFGVGAPALPTLSTSDELLGPTIYVTPAPTTPPAPPPPRTPRPPRPARIGGVTTAYSLFRNDIIGLTSGVMNGVVSEIKTQATQSFQPRERINPRQLLYLLKEGDIARRGITNAEMRRSHALLSTNMMIEDVKNEQLFRQTNQELMERRAATTLGSNRLNRFMKRLTAGLTGGILDGFLGRKVFRARDVMDYIAGTDKDLAVFQGMRSDITLPELRDLIDSHGGVSDSKLYEYANKLREVFIGFQMMNSEGRVEFYDADAVIMEEIIRKLLLVRTEIRSRKTVETVEGLEGNKAQLMLSHIKEDGGASDQDEKDILSQIRDKVAGWKTWFSRRVLGREHGERYAEARKFMDEQGMSRTERRAYESSQGLTTIATTMGSIYAGREWLTKGKTATRWGAGKAGSGMRSLYDNALRPIGHYGIKKPAEWLLWKPAKWTVQTAGKVAAFPFLLAGSIGGGLWNWTKPKRT